MSKPLLQGSLGAPGVCCAGAMLNLKQILASNHELLPLLQATCTLPKSQILYSPWRSCHRFAGDLPGRLAVVPMSQEARGLDAGPRLQGRLVGWGDNRSAAIVGRIAAEERAHVAVGQQKLPITQSWAVPATNRSVSLAF